MKLEIKKLIKLGEPTSSKIFNYILGKSIQWIKLRKKVVKINWGLHIQIMLWRWRILYIEQQRRTKRNVWRSLRKANNSDLK